MKLLLSLASICKDRPDGRVEICLVPRTCALSTYLGSQSPVISSAEASKQVADDASAHRLSKAQTKLGAQHPKRDDSNVNVQAPPQQKDVPDARRPLGFFGHSVDALKFNAQLGIEPFLALSHPTEETSVMLQLLGAGDLLGSAFSDIVVRGVLTGGVIAGEVTGRLGVTATVARFWVTLEDIAAGGVLLRIKLGVPVGIVVGWWLGLAKSVNQIKRHCPSRGGFSLQKQATGSKVAGVRPRSVQNNDEALRSTEALLTCWKDADDQMPSLKLRCVR